VTSPNTGPSLQTLDVEDAVSALRERGLRVSAARRLVLEVLFAAGEPVSAERIAAGLEGRVPASDLASVYRNLETLESLGLVRHFHAGHGPGLYVMAGAHREYLSCEGCGRLRSVAPQEMDRVRTAIREDFGFEARFQHFPIVGLCVDCAARQARGEPMESHEHDHDEAHAHEHSHGDESHSHAHTGHDHDHVEHEHEHEHPDGTVHAHEHTHEEGLESDHAHEH
jgi:Fur family ferric uptake transcriptional regulator